jgi:hypothetical protein
VELGVAITFGKKRIGLQHPQEDPGTRIHEASKSDVQRVTKKQTLDLMEGLTPSETRKGVGNRGGAGNVEALASPGRVRVRMEEKEKETEKNGRKTMNDGNLHVNRSGRAGF